MYLIYIVFNAFIRFSYKLNFENFDLDIICIVMVVKKITSFLSNII